MISDIRVKDQSKKPIVRKISRSCNLIETPSRFRKKKQFVGPTTSVFNQNFTKMPKDS